MVEQFHICRFYSVEHAWHSIDGKVFPSGGVSWPEPDTLYRNAGRSDAVVAISFVHWQYFALATVRAVTEEANELSNSTRDREACTGAGLANSWQSVSRC
jgi:hypothetical protein